MNSLTSQWTVGRRVTAGFAALGVIGAALIGVFEVGMRNLTTYHATTSTHQTRALKVAKGTWL